MSFLPRPVPILLLVLLMAWNGPAVADTFTVNSTDDSNASPCDAVHCTLREAIGAANALAGADRIEFDIAGGGASPEIEIVGGPLPAITEAVEIDASTQPGFAGAPIIELIGTVGAGDGFTIDADGVTIRGFVIEDFPGHGISIHGSDNLVEGNYIGTGPSGTDAHGNGNTGVLVGSAGGPNADNVIRDNVISANGDSGVWVLDATRTRVVDNRIGTDPAGSLNLGNAEAGVEIEFAAETEVSGNTIRSNAGDGVHIHDGATDNTVGGTDAADRNVIFLNGRDGVQITDTTSSGNVVAGNFIGTDPTGTLAGFGNSRDGVLIDFSQSNTVGGADAASRNVISGNRIGVRILGFQSRNNVVSANYIGTDVTGTAPLGNVRSGVVLTSGAHSNRIGGTGAEEGNVIADHTRSSGIGYGVNFADAGNENLVLGNFIGTDATGTQALPNDVGIRVLNAPFNQIGSPEGTSPGGPCQGGCNLVSGHDGLGAIGIQVRAQGDFVPSATNWIRSNFVGTDVTGEAALPNRTGIQVELIGEGIQQSGVGCMVTPGSGGVCEGGAESGNLVSGNLGPGITWSSAATPHNLLIVNNRVGLSASGAPLGNGSHGILLSGTDAILRDNVVAHNAGAGLAVADREAVRNLLSPNSTFENGGLGIDLGADGVTPNDPMDDDGYTNLPGIVTALRTGTTTSVVVRFMGAPMVGPVEVHLYENDACDPSGLGEGRTFLAMESAFTNSIGVATYLFVLPDGPEVGTPLTALAHLASTSEFSACRTVEADADGDAVPDVGDNCTFVPNESQLDTDGDAIGNACDCDFDQDGFCTLADFTVFLPDFVSGVDGGAGTDMDGDGGVTLADFTLFLPGFVAGVPGPAAGAP